MSFELQRGARHFNKEKN